jgi:xanthine dehydrogenase YagR molybdenum-binding subunit
MDPGRAARLPGVIAVLTVFDAPELADTSDGELTILQDDRVHFRGQPIGAVVAESAETAREAAGLVSVDDRSEPHHTELRPDDSGLYTPEQVNPSFPTDTEEGDVDGALAGAAVRIERTYRTPTEHNTRWNRTPVSRCGTSPEAGRR